MRKKYSCPVDAFRDRSRSFQANSRGTCPVTRFGNRFRERPVIEHVLSAHFSLFREATENEAKDGRVVEWSAVELMSCHLY